MSWTAERIRVTRNGSSFPAYWTGEVDQGCQWMMASLEAGWQAVRLTEVRGVCVEDGQSDKLLRHLGPSRDDEAEQVPALEDGPLADLAILLGLLPLDGDCLDHDFLGSVSKRRHLEASFGFRGWEGVYSQSAGRRHTLQRSRSRIGAPWRPCRSCPCWRATREILGRRGRRGG